MGNVGEQVRLLALDGRNAELAGGFPSDPILSGPRRTGAVCSHVPAQPAARQSFSYKWGAAGWGE